VTEQTQKELNTIVKTIADTGVASRIILFGSMARGEETPESDIDLCVITPIKDRRPLDISIDLRRKLFNVKNVSLDLLTYNQDNFDEHAASPSSFAHLINTEGVVVYER
jgi:predicted nucleotidyltransferase